MSTNHNQTPNHNQAPDTGDTLRDQDPAAAVIDTASKVRDSLYESGASTDDMENMFNDEASGGTDGAKELIDLANTVRNENRPLTPHEQKFVDYMESNAALRSAEGSVNFDDFYAPLNTFHESGSILALTGEAAAKKRVENMVAEREQLRNTSTSEAQKQRLEEQILDLQAYLMTIDDTSDDHVADAYMNAYRENATLGTPESQTALDTADTELSEGKTKAEILARAYAVISEDYSRTPDSPDDLADDPRLAYAAVAPAAPDQQPAAPATNPNQQPNPADAQKAAKLEAIRAEMEQKELDTIRDQLAGNKSRLFKKGGPEVAALEARYNDLVTRKTIREYGDVLTDPDVDQDIKNYVATKAVFEEQARLREATNEKMKDTAPAKMGRWIGKHKFLTVAGLTILVPLTGGTAAFGLAAGAGLLAASKADSKLRGMRSTEKSFSQTRLHDLMRSGASFQGIQEYAMEKYDEDRSRERWKRIGVLGIGGAALFATFGLLPPMHGLTNGINSTQHFLWNHLQ